MKTIQHALLVTSVLSLFAVSTANASPSTVNVHLWNDNARMGVQLDQQSVPNGKVTFAVTNDSNMLEHEMLIIKVKNFHDSLAYNDSKARIIEDDVNDYGEVSELQPGKSGAVTLNLDAGKYLLACNIGGHFESGMFTQLIVTP